MSRGAAADLAGRVLAGRYRLVAPIGAGASGQVYLAHDARLNRRVAVKVLHAGLAEDPAFLRRFRSEAQLAASLQHPHIVSVYDWGEEGTTPFMVLELLTGGSLRGMLDAGHRLSVAQSAQVGRQVLSALAHAHARGFVHRDVKSSNLLFDEHAHVRIADFGLARALAEASWTEPDGGLIGTARYAAPEQARGAALDGRADLYSLAIVLVEAVTGQVPNVGETAVATIAARQREGIVVPRELGRLGPVLARAGRPDPDDRYPDATTMSSALDEAARQLAPAEPLILPGLGTVLDDPEPTEHAGGLVVDPDRTVGAGSTGPGLFDQDAVTAATPRGVAEPVVVYREHRVLPAIVAIAIVAALVVAGAVLAGATSGGGARVAAPSLVGMTRADAATAVATKGFVVAIEQRRTDDPKGLVIGQSPKAGAFLGRGGTVHLIVSSGPPPVVVPKVAGLSQNDAQALLESKGFVVTVQLEYDETIAKGSAISTRPIAPGAKAAADSAITLIISNGPTPIPVIDVKGLTYDDAAAKITAAGFVAARKDVFDDTTEVGKVVGTDPAAGAGVQKGGTVTILVSKGPELVSVPNVVGMAVEAASKALTDLGLVPAVQNYGPGKKVLATAPIAGTQVKKGSTVTLFL